MVTVFLAARSVSGAPVFIGLGDLPGSSTQTYYAAEDVSADGSVVVGTRSSRDGARAFRWTAETGMQDLGPGSASGISADGSVIVGSTPAPGGGHEAYRWSSETGMQLLGDLPGGGDFSWASAVSADGSIVVGQSDSGAVGQIVMGGQVLNIRSFGEAFRWTAESGMQPLGLVRPDPTYRDYGSFATGISADGSVIVGGGTVGDTYEGDDADRYDSGLLWVGGSGPLAPQVGSCCEAVFRSISPDGSTIGGGTWDAGGGGGFWAKRSPDGSIVLGGHVPNDETGNVWDVSLHGDVLVGDTDQDGPDAYVLFNGGSDFYYVEDYISSVLGLDITGWHLESAMAVSWDGRTIVGSGVNPSGQSEPWLLIVPEPTVSQCLLLGLVALAFSRSRSRQRVATRT